MMKLVRRIVDELGKTFVLVLHDINFASIYSDQIVAMRDGAIIRQGPPVDILQTSALQDIFDVSIPVHEIDGERLALFYL